MEARGLALRESSHEYSIFRSVSDSAERVARIHSFRVAVIEPTNELLLAVTFDGARESYIRVLHQRIGTLLDLLFCNTEAHVPAFPCEPKDLTGAGDMLAGAFLYGITHGVPPRQALRAACYLAMKVITKIGARLHHGTRQFWNEMMV